MNISQAAKYIKDNINIYEYITRFYNIEFKKSGSSYKALCPLGNHDHNTPSFSIPEGENYFNCFGCNQGGSLIKFVELYENVDNEDAIKLICDNIGIDLNNKLPEAHKRKVDSNNSRMIKYVKNLVSENKEALEYITNKRHLSLDIIKEFKLGATLENKDMPHLSNRIVFPLEHNGLKNTVLAFTYGYINDASNYNAKYINDKTNNVFTKSEMFYGYNQAFMHIKASKRVYIVEGYFDVLSMHQAGIKNTMGIMCASISDKHIEMLKKLNCEVVLFTDTDKAGDECKLNSISKLIGENIKVKVIDTKDFKDPDELCNKYKFVTNDILKFINRNTKDSVLYYLKNDIDELQNTILDMKSKILNKANSLLSSMDETERDLYKEYISRLLSI